MGFPATNFNKRKKKDWTEKEWRAARRTLIAKYDFERGRDVPVTLPKLKFLEDRRSS